MLPPRDRETAVARASLLLSDGGSEGIAAACVVKDTVVANRGGVTQSATMQSFSSIAATRREGDKDGCRRTVNHLNPIAAVVVNGRIGNMCFGKRIYDYSVIPIAFDGGIGDVRCGARPKEGYSVITIAVNDRIGDVRCAVCVDTNPINVIGRADRIR